MADRFAFPTDGDLSRDTFERFLYHITTSFFVSEGMEVDPNWSENTIAVQDGVSVVYGSGRRAVLVSTDRRTSLNLQDGTVNHIYVTSVPSRGEIDVEVTQSDSPPSDFALRVAEVDTSNNSVTPTNRGRKGEFRSINLTNLSVNRYKGNDIDSDGDGVMDEADSANHVAGSDVSGAVSNAEQASNAASVGGVGLGDLLRSDQNDATDHRLGVEHLQFDNLELSSVNGDTGDVLYDRSDGLFSYSDHPDRSGWNRYWSDADFSPDDFAESGHTHSGLANNPTERLNDTGTVPFPGVTLSSSTDSPDNSAFNIQWVPGNKTMNVTRVQISTYEGVGPGGDVEMRINHLGGGGSATVTGGNNTRDDPDNPLVSLDGPGNIRFELVNVGLLSRRISAQARFELV